MGIALKLGQKIPLKALAQNRATGKVVRAIVKDATNVSIAGSPVTLPHVGDGVYFLDTLVMPNTPNISVEYDPFDGPGFTNPSTDILPTSERFEFDEDFEGTRIFAGSEVLTGNITSDTLEGTVEDDKENLSGEISDEEKLSGELSEETVSGSIEDPTNISGGISEDTIQGDIKGDC